MDVRSAAACPLRKTPTTGDAPGPVDGPTLLPFRRPLCLLALVAVAAGCGGGDGGTGPAEQTLDPASLVASAAAGEPGQPTDVVVNARDTEGQPFLGPLPGLELEIRGTNPGTVTGGVDNGDGSHTLSYTPAKIGFDTLIAKLNGTTIAGTPFASRVRIVWVAASGTPTIDGVASPGEWDAAEEYAVFGGPTLTGSTVRFMADATNLYVLVTYPDSVDGVGVRFDNSLDLALDGDDLIAGGSFGFSDQVFDGGNYVHDNVANGNAAVTLTSSSGVHELSHPLNSGDPQDIAVGAGARLGVCLQAGIGGSVVDSSAPATCILIVTQQEVYAELQLP